MPLTFHACHLPVPLILPGVVFTFSMDGNLLQEVDKALSVMPALQSELVVIVRIFSIFLNLLSILTTSSSIICFSLLLKGGKSRYIRECEFNSQPTSRQEYVHVVAWNQCLVVARIMCNYVKASLTSMKSTDPSSPLWSACMARVVFIDRSAKSLIFWSMSQFS